MSGGHFNYKCYSISQFADELKHEIQNNTTKNQDNYSPSYSKKTIAILTKCHKIINQAGELSKEIEWLYSGDHGEDSFNEIVSKIFRTKRG